MPPDRDNSLLSCRVSLVNYPASIHWVRHHRHGGLPERNQGVSPGRSIVRVCLNLLAPLLQPKGADSCDNPEVAGLVQELFMNGESIGTHVLCRQDGEEQRIHSDCGLAY